MDEINLFHNIFLYFIWYQNLLASKSLLSYLSLILSSLDVARYSFLYLGISTTLGIKLYFLIKSIRSLGVESQLLLLIWDLLKPSPLFLKHYSRTLPMTHSCGRSRSQSPRSLFLDPSPIIVISQILDPKSANMRSLATRERAQDNSSIIVGSTSYDHNCQTMGPSTVTLRPLPLAMLTVGVVVDPLPPASQEDDASHLIVVC